MQKEEKRAGKKPEHGQKWARVKTWLASALLWLAKLLCVIISGVALLLVARLIFAQTVYESENVKVVEIGLSIIGAAVAVWAGLNIANSIERKELEDLRARTDGVKKLVDNLDNIASIAYDTFLQALLHMGNDDATAYFYKEFSKRGVNSSINYYTLTRIEDLFGQTYNLHNTVQHLDTELLQKAEEALDYIEGFATEDRLVKIYLTFRKAEFNYYCGYVAATAKEQYQYFSEAISLYQKILPKMGVILPQYAEDKEIPDMPDNTDRRLMIYMANTIGDAGSKIVEKTADLSEKEDPEDDKIPIETIRKFGELAMFYCGCAAKWTDEYSINDIHYKDLHYHEKNYRNYGVACERFDRAFKPENNHADIIIENYLKAFYHIIKGTKLPAQRVQSVYYVLLSYFKRYFDNELKFEGNNGPLSPFSGPEALAAASKYNYLISDEQLKYLQQMADISQLAMVDMPRENIPTVMNGFAYTYVILLKTAGNAPVCNAFKEDYSVYIEMIAADIRKLDIMKIDDDYLKELKKRYAMLSALLDSKKSNS